MRMPPKRVCIGTMRAGSSRTSPMIPASSPPFDYVRGFEDDSRHSLYETFRSSLSAIQTLIID
jgi:hypothetical protein